MNGKYTLWVLFAVFMFMGCKSNEVIPFNNRFKVAILPVQSQLTDEDKKKKENLAEQAFTTELMEEQRVRLIERGRIDQLLKEHALIQQGLIDEKNAAKIGKMAGADAVLISELFVEIDEALSKVPMVEYKKVRIVVRISARIIDVETGEILAAASDYKASEEDLGVTISPQREGGETYGQFSTKKINEKTHNLIVAAADHVADDLSDMMPSKK